MAHQQGEQGIGLGAQFALELAAGQRAGGGHRRFEPQHDVELHALHARRKELCSDINARIRQLDTARRSLGMQAEDELPLVGDAVSLHPDVESLCDDPLSGL